MAKGAVQLRTHIAKIRDLKNLGRDSIKAIKKEIGKSIEAQVAAQTEPDGKPWKPRKVGSGAVLSRAANQAKIASRGNVIAVTLTGHYARHQLGAVRGKVKRRIIPSKKLPDPYSDAIRKALGREFKRVMK